MVFGAGIFPAIFVSSAVAGCGDIDLTHPLVFSQALASKPAAETATPKQRGGGGFTNASMVGMWNVQFISEGNTSHSPSIPDGAVILFGYEQWHSDGTEFANSNHNPATQNYCIGVWGETGFNTYELNHFALQYDSTGTVNGVANIREQATLSPSGDSWSGTFTIDYYDSKANKLDHIAGNLTATRVTVDTPVTAFP